LVAGVWFGNDDNSPMKHVTGGTLPARTWHNFMAGAVQNMPVRPLPMPGAAVAYAPSSGGQSPPPQSLLPPPGPASAPGAASPSAVGTEGGILQGLVNSIFGPPNPSHRPPGAQP